MADETIVTVDTEQDASHDETPIIHTAHELELEAEIKKIREENEQLKKTNRELFIKAGGDDPAREIDPVAATDERLLNIVKGGFSARSIREV